MNKRTALLEKLTKRRLQDYSFTVAFFITFSFFVFFAIRPNLLTAFNLQKQLTELQAIDANYENVIVNIVQLQSSLEENRDNFHYLDEALSTTPQLNKVINDLTTSATLSGITLQKIDVGELDLKDDSKKDKRKNYSVLLEVGGDFNQVNAFMKNFMAQRRLKMVKKLSIFKDDIRSSGSADLRIKMEVEGYYL